MEPAIDVPRRYPRSLLYGTIIGIVIFMPIATGHPDISLFLNLFFVAPTILVVSGVLTSAMIVEAKRAIHRNIPPLVATLAILWIIPTSVFFYNRDHRFELHESVRWLVSSRKYKSQVLAQPTSTNGELKHIEWDGTGFAGVAYETVFLSFRPGKLSVYRSRKPPTGKIGSIPCKFRIVRRLESQWYTVLFYTDQSWNDCN